MSTSIIQAAFTRYRRAIEASGFPNAAVLSSRQRYWYLLVAFLTAGYLIWMATTYVTDFRSVDEYAALLNSALLTDRTASISILQHFNLHDDRVHHLQNHSMAQHRRYAEFWGYGYITSTLDLIPSDWTVRQRQMNKIYALMVAVLAELEKGERSSAWIMICDADTLIADPSIPVHALLPPDDIRPGQPPLILGTNDWNGFNSGVVLYRCNLDTVAFLSHALQRSDDITREFHEAGSPEGMETPPSDQRAVCLVLQEQSAFASRFFRYPQNWLNNYDLPSEGSPVSLHIHLVSTLKYQEDLSPYFEENAQRWSSLSNRTGEELKIVVEELKGQAIKWWKTGDTAMPDCTWI